MWGGTRAERVIAKGYRISCWGDENSKIYYGVGFRYLWIYKNHWIAHFKWMNYMTYFLDLNKKNFFKEFCFGQMSWLVGALSRAPRLAGSVPGWGAMWEADINISLSHSCFSLSLTLPLFKISGCALAGAAQWIECQPLNQRITSSIPSQGTCLDCRPGLL